MKQPRDTDTFSDDLRPEYHRKDFGAMVRGKYASRLRETSNMEEALPLQTSEIACKPLVEEAGVAK